MASDSDHYMTPRGEYIRIVPMQDALGPHCTECERTVIPRASGGTEAEPWQHAMGCSQYRPHPDSIAGQPDYAA
ncbi:hypothetical protein [Arthrobacter globiformis]|uniref:hypothetical protein n=1 Tax=Arthrobacter globiformis TaxID=1665 RepID=UPI0011250D96|nr:hypothetical protein [Arthrobacter globiformis]